MTIIRGWRTFVLTILVVAMFATAAQAGPIFISQIYTGSLAPYSYIELFNSSTGSVNMNGWSIQASAPSQDSTWTVQPLAGTLAPGQYYLIRIAATSTVRAAPAPDTDLLGFPVSSTGGQLAVIQNTTRLLVPCSTTNSFPVVSDFVSWGSSPCGSLTNPWQDSLAMTRSAGGCVDAAAPAWVLASPIPHDMQSITNPCGAAANTSVVPFTVPAAGGFSGTTSGSGAALTGGFATVEPASGNTNPTALSVFALRQNGTLISEATVPATTALTNGAFFVNTLGSLNNGVAIVNQNIDPVSIQYQLTDTGSGRVTQSGSVTLPPKSQTARFLTELPWTLTSPAQGTFSFSAPEPVSIIALRGNTNSRGDFLVTTIPVTDTSAPTSTSAGYIAHFAVNNGWTTELQMICISPNPCTGTVSMRDATGAAAIVRADTLVASSFPYSLGPYQSQKVLLSGTGNQVSGGTIQIAPSNGSVTPGATAVFSYSHNGITVSEAGVTTPVGTQFRTYVEYSGIPGTSGSIQAGVAIANTAASSTSVTLTLNGLDGSTTGLTATVTIPANGQLAKFINEMFPSLTAPFKGILTVTSNGGPIAVIGLRGHYNERDDFLITTVQAVDQNAPIPTSQVTFPHIVDSGGYTTQFILFGSQGQATKGNLRLFTTGGQPLVLTVK